MKHNIIRSFLLAFVVLVFSTSNGQTVAPVSKQSPVTSQTFNKSFNFIIVSDWGWNGAKHQQEVADQMGKIADSVNAKFIVSCGDNFQINGVASTQDPLWTANFENVYKPLSLQVEWFPVLGNHDYKGSPQAEINYSKISRRWRLTDHYYTFAKKISDSISARLIFLDTPPLVGEYYTKNGEYPEITQQDTAAEMKWLKDVLKNSREQWILVFGHHPVYSASHKHGNTREMIDRVKPLLEQYHAQFYFCGHDHDLQHLREKNDNLEYIVSGTGGDTRENSSNDMTVFSGSEPAFTVVSLKSNRINVCFVSTLGKVIYSYNRSYK